MKSFALEVNGRKIEGAAEPRTHLADFLREQCRLTGTHLGCEHGVCGACTVMIDGAPARSCIAYAVACDGSRVQTIEGFDDDSVMGQLREAFSREHALQCGFCTPGMLISARDIVLRLPDADERRIRVELSGNLCRCTGYVGIVNAIKSVIALRRAEAAAPSPAIAAAPAVAARFETFAAQASASAAAPAPARVEEAESTQGWTAFEESFVVLQPPSVVWAALADVPRVAGCLPGAEVSEYDGRTIKGRVGVKLGPMSAAFAGSAVVERDEAALSGAMRGAGGDRLSGSRTKGEASYSLRPEADGAHTRVDLLVRYNLVGPLAQFSRSNLVRDLGRRLVAEFARNLNAQIGQTGAAVPAAPIAPARLNLLQFLWAWMMDRIRGRKG